MPTGYTANIGDGMTFEEYALGCARAFGALLQMRDEPMDAKIPEEFQPSTYHLESLDRARTRLKAAESMTIAEAEIAAGREHDDAVESWNRSNSKREELRLKYEKMLSRVRAWIPPSPEHREYKRFMESQIEESIRFDCGFSISRPVRLNGPEWAAKEIEKAQKDIDYHTEQHQKEVERVEGANRWVRQLRESLKGQS